MVWLLQILLILAKEVLSIVLLCDMSTLNDHKLASLCQSTLNNFINKINLSFIKFYYFIKFYSV